MEDFKEKLEALTERVKELEEENRELKERMGEESREAEAFGDTGNVSRRDFLKKVGLGAAGIGALSLTPAASQLKLTKNGISSSSGIDISGSTSMDSNLDLGGNVLENIGGTTGASGGTIRMGAGTQSIFARDSTTPQDFGWKLKENSGRPRIQMTNAKLDFNQQRAVGAKNIRWNDHHFVDSASIPGLNGGTSVSATYLQRNNDTNTYIKMEFCGQVASNNVTHVVQLINYRSHGSGISVLNRDTLSAQGGGASDIQIYPTNSNGDDIDLVIENSGTTDIGNCFVTLTSTGQDALMKRKSSWS